MKIDSLYTSHAQLDEGEIDLALGVFPQATGDIQKEPLFTGRFICLADKHAIPASGTLTLDECLDKPHVMLAMVPGTDLVLRIASRSVMREHDDRGFCQFEPPLPLPEFDDEQAWHRRKNADPAHQWLRRAIRES